MPKIKNSELLRVVSIIIIVLITLGTTYGIIHAVDTRLGGDYSDIVWTMNGEEVSLPYYGSRISDRDIVVLSAVMPEIENSDVFIGFFNRNGKYDVFIDDNILQSGGYETDEDGIEIPSIKWNTLHCDSSIAGHRITIKFYLNETADHYTIEPIYIGRNNNIILDIIAEDGIVFFLDGALMFTGIMIMVVSVSSRRYNENAKGYLFFGVFCILFSFWILTERNILYYYFNGVTLNVLSYVFLALLPIPLIFFVGSDAGGIWKTCYRITAVVGGLITIFLAVLALFNANYLVNTVLIIHIYFLIVLIYTVVYKFYGRIALKKKERYAGALGICVIASFGVIEMLRVEINGINSSTAASTPVFIGFFIYAICIGIDMLLEFRNTLEQVSAQKIMIEEAKTQLVLSQIKPHFVYNSLGAIRVLIKKDPDAAYDALYTFTRYLRQNIDALENSAPIPFKTELEHIRTYIDIERLRFQNKVEVVFKTDFTNFSVPPLSIQIFVENAMKHGVFQKPEGGTICVRSYMTQSDVYIEVEDDGVGFDPSTLQSGDGHRGIGIKNAIYRIENTVGGKCDIRSAPGQGTTVIVKLPKNKVISTEGNL